MASRVLKCSGIPPESTRNDLEQLVMPFGTMTNIFKNESEALLEVGDPSTAQSMIDYYSIVPPAIRGTTVSVQLSNDKELKAALNSAGGSEGDNEVAKSADSQGKVLKVIVTNIIYPMTIEVLKQIFSPFGEVEKIATFVRNDQFHAFVQFSEAADAQKARESLDRRNIYNGCNTMHIEYSSFESLDVKYNNEKMRDFTKPDPPTIANPHIAMAAASHVPAELIIGGPAEWMKSQMSSEGKENL